MVDLNKLANINQIEIATEGLGVYEKIKQDLEKNHIGEFVAIDPQSGDYFLGSEPIEAINKGKEKYPDNIFYLVKIGFPAVTRMSSRYKPLSYGSFF